MEEIWKDIIGFPGYQVSNLGRVRSLDRIDRAGRNLRGKTLRLSVSTSGYYDVKIYNIKKKTFTVHSLVAKTFLNHKGDNRKIVINHKDFNKLNNNVNNLEIVSNRENTNQKHLKSSSKYTGVTWSKKSEKWQAGIRINQKSKHLGLFDTELEASEAYQNELTKLTKE